MNKLLLFYEQYYHHYLLMCGHSPFYGETNAEIIESIKKGYYDFERDEWNNVSSECKDLVMRLLTKDPKKRFNASQALNHSWIKSLASGVSGVLSPKMVHNIKSFKTMRNLKKSIITYIATQVSEAEVSELRKRFLALDTDGDGKLSLMELRQAMKDQGSPTNFKEILRSMDTDKSGFIDYTEFIAATLGREIYTKEAMLFQAFHAFDQDGNGKISASELRAMIGPDSTSSEEQTWTELIKEADTNHDGEIDYKEFVKLMRGFRSASLPIRAPFRQLFFLRYPFVF